jgi:putative transposase
VKYAWIDAQRRHYDLAPICAVLGVSVSGYRAWKGGGQPERKRLTDAQMLVLIRPSISNSRPVTAARGWLSVGTQ